MYVKGFMIGFDKNKRLWAIMFFAIIIALTLIITAFVNVYKANTKIISSEDIDIEKITSYTAKYNLNVKSNKNENNYTIEEKYGKNEENEYFKFSIFSDDEIITYTLNDGALSIKSNKQKLEYTLSDYIIKKENVISIATFFDLYKSFRKDEKNNFKITVEEQDNKIMYIINIGKDQKALEEYNFLKDISKLEIIIDKEKKLILEYLVYDRDYNLYIDITYDNFIINKYF